jgi:hypothetical protein
LRARHAAGVLALAALSIVIAYGVSLRRGARQPAPPREIGIPSDDLLVAVASADLAGALDALGESRFWASVLQNVRPARRFVGTGPGALGVYRGGWLVLGARAPDVVPPVSGRSGDWTASASAGERLPDGRGSGVVLPLASGVTAVAWFPAAATSPSARAWRRVLPARADAVLDVSGRELWQIRCAGPCLLDALVPRGTSGELAWAALPRESVAAAAAAFDPRRLEEVLDLDWIAEFERFLALPMRRELSRALAGQVAVALVEEPRPGAAAALVVSVSLASTDLATALVERVLALGVLSGEVGLERYRGVTIGAWSHPRGLAELRPAVAIDGDVLFLATRASDIVEAIDRRRLARPAPSPARAALERLGPAAWRAWSRSSFVRTGWLELATGRRAERALPAGEVTAKLTRRKGGWVLEGEGAGPAFVADPLLPAARSWLRASRVQE